jgi:hypothetical protein
VIIPFATDCVDEGLVSRRMFRSLEDTIVSSHLDRHRVKDSKSATVSVFTACAPIG